MKTADNMDWLTFEKASQEKQLHGMEIQEEWGFMRPGCRVGMGKAVPPVWAQEGVGNVMRSQNDHDSEC